MRNSQRILRVLALSFGLLGLIGCVAAAVGGWSVSGRLRQATEDIFQKLDGTLVVVQDRILQTRKRVDASKVTADEIAQTLKERTKMEAVQRVATRFDTEEKIERLASMLQQAAHWLEVSGSSAELVQQALSMASSAGSGADPAVIDAVIEEIASLRTQLAEVTKFIAGIRERTGEKLPRERIEQAVQSIVRAAATLGIIDSRLERFANRLSETRQDLQGLKAQTCRRIRLASAAVALIIVWMAAGQVALSLCAWRPCREDQARPSENL